MVEDGVSGWLARGTDAPALASAIERVLDHRDSVPELVRDLEPRNALRRLSDPQRVREQYLALAAARASRGRPRRSVDAVRPLVSAVVPYYRLHRYIGETIASLFEQTYAPLEVIVVNDGSFYEEDAVLGELATSYPIVVLTQENTGLGAARNFGISQSRGRYIFPFDADNVATPTFVDRCVEVLERRDDVAYVTSWSRYIDHEGKPIPPPVEGYQPLSNDVRTLRTANAAGDAAAVLRRRIFDRGFWYTVDTASSYEDWLLYRRLHAAGLYGHVIPERLLHYRVRETSMFRKTGLRHHERLLGEMDACLQGAEVEWTS